MLPPLKTELIATLYSLGGSWASAVLCGPVSLSSRPRPITSYTSRATWHQTLALKCHPLDRHKIIARKGQTSLALSTPHFPLSCNENNPCLSYLTLQVRIKRNTGVTRLWEVKSVIAMRSFNPSHSDTGSLILWAVAMWMLKRPLFVWSGLWFGFNTDYCSSCLSLSTGQQYCLSDLAHAFCLSQQQLGLPEGAQVWNPVKG